jgi:hypothetical protein
MADKGKNNSTGIGVSRSTFSMSRENANVGAGSVQTFAGAKNNDATKAVRNLGEQAAKSYALKPSDYVKRDVVHKYSVKERHLAERAVNDNRTDNGDYRNFTEGSAESQSAVVQTTEGDIHKRQAKRRIHAKAVESAHENHAETAESSPYLSAPLPDHYGENDKVDYVDFSFAKKLSEDELLKKQQGFLQQEAILEMPKDTFLLMPEKQSQSVDVENYQLLRSVKNIAADNNLRQSVKKAMSIWGSPPEAAWLLAYYVTVLMDNPYPKGFFSSKQLIF